MSISFWSLLTIEKPPGRQNAETLARLEKTKEQLTEATNDFIKCRHQAYGAYLADPTYIKPPTGAATTAESQVQFNSWAKTFYPSYQLASLRKDAASQEAYEAHLEYYGPQTASLWNDRVQLDQAFVPNSLNKPYVTIHPRLFVLLGDADQAKVQHAYFYSSSNPRRNRWIRDAARSIGYHVSTQVQHRRQILRGGFKLGSKRQERQ